MRSMFGLFMSRRGVACGQFRLPSSCTWSGSVLPVKSPFMSAAGRRNPQHFHRLCTGLVPFCTSDPQAYAHTAGQAVLLPGWQPAADQCAGACVTCPPCRTPGPGVDGIAAWTGSRKKAPMFAAALQDRRPVYPPAACRSCHPASRSARAPRPVTVRPAVTPATSWNATRPPRRTPGSAAGQGPRPYPVMTADRRGGAFPAVAACWAVPARTFGPGRIRQGPSMYEMEGPCPASPHRLASCLALLAQRAARRGQAPARGTGLPAPPAFPGSPPGDARFRTVKYFYCLCRRRARARGRPFSGFSLSTKNPRKTSSYPHLTAVIHGFAHSLSTGSRL